MNDGIALVYRSRKILMPLKMFMEGIEAHGVSWFVDFAEPCFASGGRMEIIRNGRVAETHTMESMEAAAKRKARERGNARQATAQ